MKQLRRYLWKAVLLPSLAVLGVLLALEVLFSYISELDSLTGEYQALQALQFVMTTVPRRAYEFLPLAVLLGTLLGLGMLASNSELVVIRSAGVSTLRISWMVLRPAIVLLAIGMAVGEYIVPHAERMAQTNRALAESGEQIVRSREGYWHREGNTFIHINAVEAGGVLHGITHYRFDEHRALVDTRFAPRAIYQSGEEHWVMEDVRGSTLEADGVGRYERNFDLWETELSPEMLAIVILDPDRLALRSLWEYSTWLERQGVEAGEYLLAFWQKLLMPLGTLGMVLIAISFVFGPLRQVSMGLRLTIGIVAGMLFHYGQRFAGHMSLVLDFSPLVAALAPVVLCTVLGLWLLVRVR